MNEVADRALRLVGTKFRHQGRLPGVGLDCLGVVVFSCGIREFDQRDYHRLPEARRLREALDELFVRLDCDWLEDAPVGSVLAFTMGTKRTLRHLGIRTYAGFVHADEFMVREESTDNLNWRDRFEGAYQWQP